MKFARNPTNQIDLALLQKILRGMVCPRSLLFRQRCLSVVYCSESILLSGTEMLELCIAKLGTNLSRHFQHVSIFLDTANCAR